MLLLLAAIISGYGFIGLLPKNINGFLKLLVAPACGLFVVTQITLLASFVFGVGLVSTLISLTLTYLLAGFCFYKLRPVLDFSRIPIFFVATIIPFLFLISYIWFSQTLMLTENGLVTGGGGMYGDTALHAAYTSIITAGRFPPENPLYAGEALVYPYASDLLSAVLTNFGLNLNLAFSIPQFIFLLSFLTLLYVICVQLGRKSSFIICLFILFFGWGIGAYYFFKNWFSLNISFWQFLAQDYTNNPNYNLHFHNILTGLILPERTFIAGLFSGLLMFLLTIEYDRTKHARFLALSGLILGSVLFWHTHTAIFFFLFYVVIFVWQIRQDWKKTLRDFAVMGTLTVIMAIPFVVMFITNHSTDSFIHLAAGWQNGDENIIVFWLKNSSLIIPLALVGLVFIENNKRPYFFGAFIAFIVANVVIFQPWDWDNIKILSWSFVFFAILVSTLLAHIARKNITTTVLVTIVIIILTSSGVLSVLLQLKNKYVIYDNQDLDLATWAKANSEVDDVFLIDPIPNHPISGLSGRAVYIGYPGHLWVHGIDYSAREMSANKILAGDYELIKSLEIPVNYMVIDKNKIVSGPQNFEEVYQNQKYLVWKVN